jgi:hypothetical protein
MQDTGLFPLLRGVSIGTAGTTAVSRTCLFKVNL